MQYSFIVIILTNITRILFANGMQYLKKNDYIKNKQLSLSLRYIFVKMLLILIHYVLNLNVDLLLL